jgi:hypothetical protein
MGSACNESAGDAGGDRKGQQVPAGGTDEM